MAPPTIVAQLVNLLYNIVDRIYIGHMPENGDLALTGLGLTFPVILSISAFSALVGSGGAPIAAIFLGKQDDQSAQRILGNGVFLLLVLAAFRWTPVEYDVFIGLQGRYLIPIMPMMFLAFYNNKLLRMDTAAEIVTKVTCCIFPAISLMNMYLWTIAQ